jgi:hypothetical protein
VTSIGLLFDKAPFVRNDAVGLDEENSQPRPNLKWEAPFDLFDICMSSLSLMGSRIKWKKRVWKLFNRFTAAKSWLAVIKAQASLLRRLQKKPDATVGTAV